MSLTFPRTDIMTAARYAEQEPLRLVPRQELSRQANGVTRGKDLGPALWVTGFKTVPLTAAQAVSFEAILNSLDGVVNAFEAWDVRRRYPLAHSDGVFNDTGTIKEVGEDNKSLILENLDAGFVISVGDYFTFEDEDENVSLHQAMESVTADVSGETAAFEVRPHFKATPPDAATPVVFKNPAALFRLVPGSVDQQQLNVLHTVISFKAFQAY